MWGCVVSAGREPGRAGESRPRLVVRSRLHWRALGAGKISRAWPPAPRRVEAGPAEAACWPAAQLGADEPFETRWDSGLRADVDRGGQRLNAERVRQGYAQVATFPPNVKDQERFVTLPREVREATRGLWVA
jgi:hypothetical protein